MFRCETPSQDYGYGIRRSKTFNDSVHGHITLHRASVAIIDTPEFQRLRHLKQLGLTYYIYPGASHNRFEHSLGVAHLATEWGRHLIGSRGGPGPDGWQLRNFEPEDRAHLTILQLAGLCHDLGHGPFSHVFEKELLPKLFPGNATIVEEWHHEAMSNRIFDFVTSGESGNDVDLEDLAGLGASDTRLVKALMHGSSNPAADNPQAPWLYDVVANKRNGVDVDKFDYLLRDSKMCGVAVPLDPQRLMMFSRLDRDRQEVIFKMTEYSNLALGLFQSRAEMHRRVYTHQKVKSVEFMVCDALALAQEPLGLRDAVTCSADLQPYLHLDDSLLQRLQALRPHEHEQAAAVEKAQALLRQMMRRKLYKFVQEVTVGAAAAQRRPQLPPSAEEIIGFQSSAASGVHLRADDVIVCVTRIDHGMKASNPMDAVRFYQTRDPDMGDKAFTMPPQQVSSMLNTVFQDKKIRVYSKDPDPRVCAALKYAFEAWATRVLNTTVPGTPWRRHPRGEEPAPSGRGGGRRPPCADDGVLVGAGGGNGAGAYPGGRPAGRRGGGWQNGGGSGDDDDGEDDDDEGAAAVRLFCSQGGGSQQQPEQQQQQQQQQPEQQQRAAKHMGSGGRTRKRSLAADMAASSKAAAGGGSGSGGQGVAAAQAQLAAAVRAMGGEPPAKQGRGSGSSGGGGARGLPRIAEENDECATAGADRQQQQQQQ